jgi:outer membrane receptor protein involved in Fe transport
MTIQKSKQPSVEDKSMKLRCIFLVAILCTILSAALYAQTDSSKTVAGVIITSRNEVVPGLSLIIRTSAGEKTIVTDVEGRFSLTTSDEVLALKVSGKNISALERAFARGEATNNLRIEISYRIPQVHDSLVITASPLDPAIERRNETIYRDTLFSRDDQVFHTLDAGINAGQHEGGGKSLEIRRFGFNLDHGGVSGGLKVLVDNVQQNQGTQGHGQGYLGQLKSLTPELVQDVDILNGPFNAQYGDFSGLGVVHIRLKESLPDQVTARFQGGSFNTFRTFLAYSPDLVRDKALISYEGSRTDGPFRNPLNYQRDNVTGNYIKSLNEQQSLGIRFNFGRNDFISSGQIPLDEVFAGRLDRFGFIDHDNGGRVRTGTVSAYFKRESSAGSVFKMDGFVARSLFDLYSNFTFFLNDPDRGDEIQQHDSRFQEGVNAQYLRPFALFGQNALLTAGANYHDNQINVGLSRTVARAPFETTTRANARVSNAAAYVQQAVDLFRGRLHVDGGLRVDYFRFKVSDLISPELSGTQGASRLQPKFNLALTPTMRVPATLYFNYGRGISSQDARGVVQKPAPPRLSVTDFYQTGTALNFRRWSLSSDLFLIDRSNEQVYIPDDGSIEFKGPSRAYGFEIKSAVSLTRYLNFNAGVTRVMNAFYRGTSPREYVDSAPHTVTNAALTLGGWSGWSGSLRYRHAGNYRLDPFDPGIRAAGFDVLDLSLSKRLLSRVELNLAIDNLTNKRYFETQNYFESRLLTDQGIFDPVENRLIFPSRLHATPGYGIGFTMGLTFRLSEK